LSAYARLRLRVVSPGAGEVHYIDDVRFDVTRYTGFIDGWRTQWSGGSGSYAVVPLAAASRMARLGLSQKVKSVIEQEIIADGPVAYYTLGEPEGSTRANDSSGNQAAALVMAGSGTDVIFGTGVGPATDGLPAATFGGGKHLRHAAPIDTGGADWSLALAFTTSSTDVNLWGSLLGDIGGGFGGGDAKQLRVSSGGVIQTVRDSANPVLDQTLSGSTSVADGLLHTVVVVSNIGLGTVAVYVDGVDQSMLPAWDVDTEKMTLGVAKDSSGADLTPFTGTLAHYALFQSALTAGDAADFHKSCTDGFAGETTDTRLERYATWANIAADEIVTTASDIEVAHIQSDDQSVLDLMRKVETTEAGVLHDDRDGKLTLRNRNARYQAALTVTLDASSGQEVGADFNPVVDGGSLANVGDGKSLDGTVTATYTNEASREEYGDHTYSVETAATDPDEPLMLIAWVINSNAEPRPRVSSVAVAVHTLGDATAAQVMACDIGSKIRLTGLPTYTPGGTTQDFFVEGYSETFGVGTWFITFNLSPSYPYDAVFILGDATRGVLGAGNVLGL